MTGNNIAGDVATLYHNKIKSTSLQSNPDTDSQTNKKSIEMPREIYIVRKKTADNWWAKIV